MVSLWWFILVGVVVRYLGGCGGSYLVGVVVHILVGVVVHILRVWWSMSK